MRTTSTGTTDGNISTYTRAPEQGSDLINNFDFVLVFKNDEPTSGSFVQSKYAKDCCYAMINSGLELYTFMSLDKDELIVLMRAPLNVLMAYADKSDFVVKINAVEAKLRMESGSSKPFRKPVFINDGRKDHPKAVPGQGKLSMADEDKEFRDLYGAYEHIYGKFSSDDMELYETYPEDDNPTPFNSLATLKLLYYLLQADYRFEGCKIPIHTLLHDGTLCGFFPLHDRTIVNNLKLKALNCYTAPWSFDLNAIRNYFGEKFALFFAFAGHYAHSLIFPSLIGIPFQLVVWARGPDYSNPIIPFYGLVISIWAVCMLEYWRRLEAQQALEWGMSDFENKEPDRAEFKGKLVRSPVTGEKILYYPEKNFRHRLRLSFVVIVSFVACVVAVIAGIYVLRFQLQNLPIKSIASAVASILNAVQIQVFNLIYNFLANHLTDFENHRTNTSYEDSMILKIFMFQFVNSYASFFFIAFVAPYLQPPPGVTGVLGQCGYSTCMEPLSMNLGIIFGTNLFLNNGLAIVMPWRTYRSNFSRETKGNSEDELTWAERDYLLLPYDSLLDNIQNYAGMAIEYGYMVLFVVALPISPFLSVVNCAVKLKVILWKSLTLYQRPVPVGCQDIGSWMSIFRFVSVAAIVTNAALIVFTMKVQGLDSYSTQGKLWVFIGFQWVLLTIQTIIRNMIDEVPRKVAVQILRSNFIASKLIDGVPDDVETASQAKTQQNREIDLQKRDDDHFKKSLDDVMAIRYGAEPDIPVLDRPVLNGRALDGVDANSVFSSKSIHTAVQYVKERDTEAGASAGASPEAREAGDLQKEVNEMAFRHAEQVFLHQEAGSIILLGSPSRQPVRPLAVRGTSLGSGGETATLGLGSDGSGASKVDTIC